jgi:hypothetical protein
MKTIYRSRWGDVLPTCGEFVWGESKNPPERFGGVSNIH